MFIDGFGNKPVYEDKGIRKRAILAVGKQDFVFYDTLIPLEKGINIIGASSDHLIVDISDCDKKFQVGDVLSFEMFYPNTLYLSLSNYVTKEYI